MAETRIYAGHACAQFSGERVRTELVDRLAPAQPHVVRAFDTTDMDSPPRDFGRNGRAGVP